MTTARRNLNARAFRQARIVCIFMIVLLAAYFASAAGGVMLTLPSGYMVSQFNGCLVVATWDPDEARSGGLTGTRLLLYSGQPSLEFINNLGSPELKLVPSTFRVASLVQRELPLWPLLLVVEFLLAWRLLRIIRRLGCCPTCGYDTRNIESGNCPECGAPIETAPTS
ncbi:MAG: hypothetical protein CMJ32_02885 [Phycisphaerae bacterium]|nr:hypothetical protein [Phycisphaerae bacterium]